MKEVAQLSSLRVNMQDEIKMLQEKGQDEIKKLKEDYETNLKDEMAKQHKLESEK